MRKKAWRDWITINDLAGKWDSGFEEAIIDIPIGDYDYASLVDVGDAYSLTLYGNGGGSIGLGWFNTTQEAIDRLNSYFNNIYYDDGERLPSYNTYLTDPEDLKRQRGAARKYAYTDEQMKILRNHYFDNEVNWLIDSEIEEVFSSLEEGLMLADGKLGQNAEYSYSTQNRGLYAESILYHDFDMGYDISDERPEPLPEYFPNSGLWCDADFADAYNAYIPKMSELHAKALDAADEINRLYEEYQRDPEYYGYDYESAKEAYWDAYAEFVNVHEEALDAMCRVATKLLNAQIDYYYSDEAFENWLNDFGDEEVLEMIGWVDEY